HIKLIVRSVVSKTADIDVRNNADYFDADRFASINHMFANRTLVRPVAARHRFVDDCHERRIRAVGHSERAAGQDRNTHGAKVIRTNAAEPESGGSHWFERRPALDIEEIADRAAISG